MKALCFACIAVLCSLAQAGCDMPMELGDGFGGDGGTFSAADLNGVWSMAACMPAASGLAAASYRRLYLTISGGTNFSYNEAWYASSACPGGSLVLQVFASGTFTVGGLVSGGLQSIEFTVAASSMTAYTSGMVTQLNNGCSGTNFSLGTNKNTYAMTCSHASLPSGSNSTVQNVVALSGDYLSFGAFAKAVPGVFEGDAMPAKASITFEK